LSAGWLRSSLSLCMPFCRAAVIAQRAKASSALFGLQKNLAAEPITAPSTSERAQATKCGEDGALRSSTFGWWRFAVGVRSCAWPVAAAILRDACPDQGRALIKAWAR
jgi:hypothetical protein